MIIPKLRAPVVLVHGLFGYDRITLSGVTVSLPESRHLARPGQGLWTAAAAAGG
jgi:hypothetical protein